MTTTINASTSTGLVSTADTSGIIKLQSNGVTTNALAWVNFAGASGTRAANYNVSSVTRNGTGDYTITFTNALSDTNYCLSGSASQDANGWGTVVIKGIGSVTTMTTSAVRIVALGYTTFFDPVLVCVNIFGN